MRRISLTDKTDVGTICIVLNTNAPRKRLKKLEEASCQAYVLGEEPPNWMDVLHREGYVFEYIDSLCTTSKDWISKNYNDVKEHYVIKNSSI